MLLGFDIGGTKWSNISAKQVNDELRKIKEGPLHVTLSEIIGNRL
jgi:hypothetical protein